MLGAEANDRGTARPGPAFRRRGWPGWARHALAAASCSCLLLAEPALAQLPSEGAMPLRALARRRGYSGIDAYRQGDYLLARARLGEAFAFLQVPSLGLWLARTHLELGELSAAARLLAHVLRLPALEDEPPVQSAARRAAGTELSELLPRLSTLTFSFRGRKPAPDAVWVDDTRLDLHAFRLLVDPGPHVLRVQRGEQQAQLELLVREGEQRPISVQLPAPGEAAKLTLSAGEPDGSAPRVGNLELSVPAPQRVPPEADRQRARALGDAGLAAFRSKQYANAAQRLEGAFGLTQLPVYGLFAARAAREQGRLLDAISLYDRAKSAPAGELLDPAQESARSEASSELRRELSRLPLLRILLVDALRDEVSVTLDGDPLEPSAIGDEWAVEPGSHTLVARRGNETVRAVSVIQPGERRDVILQFHARELTGSVPDESPATSRAPE